MKDVIFKTAIDSFKNYIDITSKYGTVSYETQKKLLVLYFLYYLKYKSSYLYKVNYDEDSHLLTYIIDRDEESCLNSRFSQMFDCLKKDNCFINGSKLMFEPVLENLGDLQCYEINLDNYFLKDINYGNC